MELNPDDACPHCWHLPDIQFEEGGISTFSIGKLITTRGGILGENLTCNICHFDLPRALRCNHCKPGQPCGKHYATVYNGTQHNYMPIDLHFVYMRNSPYDRDWFNRPKNIGRWYANQCGNCSQAIQILKRFTAQGADVNFKLSMLRTDNKVDFQKGLRAICCEYFTGSDCLSTAVNSFYNTLLSKEIEF